MASHIEDTKRIAKNTFFLYLRSLLTMAISIYTSRIILNTLGVSDFGIYNAVGGMVGMFQMMSATFTSSTQRFISFELGKKKKARTGDVFAVALNIHFLLAFIIFIIMEVIGSWFLNCKMNIPVDRMVAANWVFQCSVATFIINLISIPYNASIIAHEKMGVFALIGVYEVVMKLLLVYLLQIILYDKLIIFALFILAIGLSVRLIYGFYCNKYFEECRAKWIMDKELYKEMLSFSGWNFFGSCSAILTLQGITLLLNLFWGVIANAAKGISMQIETAITQLVNNFMTSLNPQITKSYAAGDYEYMKSLMEKGARFSFYLMFVISLPILLETDIILQVWLGQVPLYAVVFVRLSLIFSIMQTFSNTLIVVMMATGKIKTYQITIGLIQFLNFPIAYFFLYLGFAPQVVYYVMIINSVVCIMFRIYFIKRTIKISMNGYVLNVILKSLVIVLLSLLIPLCIHNYLSSGWIQLFIVSLTCVVSTSISIFLIGLTRNEKEFVISKIKSINKFR